MSKLIERIKHFFWLRAEKKYLMDSMRRSTDADQIRRLHDRYRALK